MHDAGVRGIRFNLSPPGTTTLDMVEPLAKRIERWAGTARSTRRLSAVWLAATTA
jgi:hypothetical protein